VFLIQTSPHKGECNDEEDMKKKKAPHKTALELVDCMSPETVGTVSIAHNAIGKLLRKHRRERKKGNFRCVR